MRRYLLILLLLLAASTPKYGQSSPPLTEVVEAFFGQYDFPVRLTPFLRFECRPDGYYIVRLEYDQTLKARVKFYDQQLDDYLPLNSMDLYVDWEENTAPTSVADGKQKARNYLQQLSPYERESFGRQPYYGYPGWYHDAIAYWENQSTLSLEALHALARAYSTAATSLLANYNNYSLPEERFLLQPERPKMDISQLNQYLKATNKCLAAYKELKTRAPEFPTPIGPAKIKYANERMHVFITLLHFQGEEEARTVLEEDLYESYFLTQARNYLHSCPQNAVLVTYGDNDSYPFWYLQAHKGFRTDVIVTNISLLNIEGYRKMIQSGPFGAKPLKEHLPPFYHQPPSKIWLKTLAENPPLPYPQLQAKLVDTTAYSISTNNWTLPFPYDSIEVSVPVKTPYLYPQAEKHPFYWHPFKANNYQLPSEYFLLELLAANEWQRPLCFLPTIHHKQLLPWEKHLAWNGWVYLVVPDILTDNNLKTGIFHHTDSTYTLWQQVMEYDTVTVTNVDDKRAFYHHQINTATSFLTHLLDKEKIPAALEFSQQLLSRYPNRIYPWDHHWIALVELMRRSGAAKTAEQLLTTIASNVESNRIDFTTEEERWLLLQRVRELREVGGGK